MTIGICAHCGETKPLGVKWHGRSTLPQPDWLCAGCERDYPKGWTREQIAQASERLLAFNTELNERKLANWHRNDSPRRGRAKPESAFLGEQGA